MSILFAALGLLVAQPDATSPARDRVFEGLDLCVAHMQGQARSETIAGLEQAGFMRVGVGRYEWSDGPGGEADVLVYFASNQNPTAGTCGVRVSDGPISPEWLEEGLAAVTAQMGGDWTRAERGAGGLGEQSIGLTGPIWRVMSPSGGSILMTSAPMSPRAWLANGPMTTDVMSRILRPAIGPMGGTFQRPTAGEIQFMIQVLKMHVCE